MKTLKLFLAIFLLGQQAHAAGGLLNTATTSDGINVGSAVNLDVIGEGTAMAWISPNQVAGGEIITKYNNVSTGWEFRHNLNNLMVLNIRRSVSSQSATGVTIPVNTWWFVAATWSIANGGPKMYCRSSTGTFQDVTSAAADGSGTISGDGALNLWVGNHSANNAQYKGTIGGAAVFNRVLTADQIQEYSYGMMSQIFMTTGSVFMANVGYNVGTNQPDLSRSGNDGAISGTIPTSDGPPMFAAGGPN